MPWRLCLEGEPWPPPLLAPDRPLPGRDTIGEPGCMGDLLPLAARPAAVLLVRTGEGLAEAGADLGPSSTNGGGVSCTGYDRSCCCVTLLLACAAAAAALLLLVCMGCRCCSAPAVLPLLPPLPLLLLPVGPIPRSSLYRIASSRGVPLPLCAAAPGRPCAWAATGRLLVLLLLALLPLKLPSAAGCSRVGVGASRSSLLLAALKDTQDESLPGTSSCLSCPSLLLPGVALALAAAAGAGEGVAAAAAELPSWRCSCSCCC